MSAKILILDIETLPLLSYHWRCFKENISAKQVVDACYIASYGAKWLGEKKHFYEDTSKQTEKQMLVKLLKLLSEADMIVGHNISGFDMKKIRGRCAVHRLPIPSPYKEVDTLRAAKNEFGFEINTLEYLATVLKLTNRKSSHKKYPGFELWLGTLNGERAAWQEMKHYCLQDVDTTEELYLRIRPYDRRHPNVSVYLDNDEPTCPKCGSTKLSPWPNRGYNKWAYTNVGKYPLHKCGGCGGNYRGRFQGTKVSKVGVTTHAQ